MTTFLGTAPLGGILLEVLRIEVGLFFSLPIICVYWLHTLTACSTRYKLALQMKATVGDGVVIIQSEIV